MKSFRLPAQNSNSEENIKTDWNWWGFERVDIMKT